MNKRRDAQSRQVLIQKASGELEPFSEDKLRRSLKRAGASPAIIRQIVAHINRHAMSFLVKKELSAAGRYSIKKAIFELGPSGYPFERIVAELLRLQGYKVATGKIIEGHCVSHEIDVLAEKDGDRAIVECKFHNQPGYKSDVKVALYVQARFEDIKRQLLKQKETMRPLAAWLVTNTKLSLDAIRYANCVGIKTLGWNYPEDRGLEELIAQSGLHPVTCLKTLTGAQKRQLLARGTVLCRELVSNKNILPSIGLKEPKIARIVQEINQLTRKPWAINP
jgi:Holliday junction resolvase-like predicted endonuclease